MKKGLAALLVLLSICTQTKGAESQWHGFVSQGIIQSKDSNYINDDGDVSLQLTEVGVNGSITLTNNLRLAGQTVYLNGGNRYEEGLRLDYLFVDWAIYNDLDTQINLNIGRFKNYQWLYSATRDVPHTRPSIILPQSVYFDVFRDLSIGSDGVALKVNHNNSLGNWQLHWSYGTADFSQDQTRNLLGDSAKGQIDVDFVNQLGVYYSPESAEHTFGISIVDSDFNYQAATNDAFLDGTATSQRLMFHYRYFSENWELSSELMREKVIYHGVLAPSFYQKGYSDGAYVQLRYFLNNHWQLLTRYDTFDLDKDDRSGKKREAATYGLYPAYSAFMDQATLGLSYESEQDWKISAEFHRVKGIGRLAPVLTPNLALNDHKYWNVWAIQFMYWF